MIANERASERDWETFEAQVAAHKIAVARLTRIEDQLIAIVREHRGPPAPYLADRYTAAIDEARRSVLDTSLALFPPADGKPLDSRRSASPAAARV